MMVADPPDDVTGEFRSLGAQRQCFAMAACIGEGKHRLQVSPERQRARELRAVR
jgi:hypothetical protein